MGTRCADHVTPLYPQKLALTSPNGGGHSVGIVRSRTKATEFSLVQFPSVSIMALCRNVLQEDDILCELYVDTRSDVSDCSDTECLDSDSDAHTTSSHKQLRSSTGSLTPQFLHLFFLTL